MGFSAKLGIKNGKTIMTSISLKTLFSLLFVACFLLARSQPGKLEGLIYEGSDKEPILFATVRIPNTSTGTTSDLDGNYSLELEAGVYQIEFSSIGYHIKVLENIKIKAGETTRMDVALDAAVEILAEVEVMVSPLSRKEKSPLSLRTLRANEIQYGAGSAGDISLLLQAMPGVSSPPGYSNTINIRGGSSSENRFFVDDVEIPILNHFSKQGSSGGMRSLLNIELIDRVNLFTSAFPADKGNALSGMFEFTLKEGNSEKLSGTVQAGIIDFAVALDGPIREDANFSLSLRRSYTRFVLGLLGRPFLGTYDDWNYKVKWDLNEKHKLTLLGLGAFDEGEANDNVKETPINLFIVDQIRPTQQWNTVNALKYTNYRKQHYTHVILAHTFLEDRSTRYLLQDDSDPANLIEDYESQEGEVRLTLKNVQRYKDLKVAFGGELSRVSYRTSAFFNTFLNDEFIPLNYDSDLNFLKWGAYFQISQRLFKRFMLLTLEGRVEASDYSAAMNNPWKQFSPRFSISYAFNQDLTFNLNAGHYYQLPSGLTLSFRDPAGRLVNQSDQVSYMSATHFVGGLEWEKISTSSKINLEAFYKNYNDYPVSVADGVELINKEVNLFRTHNEAVVSQGEGRSYGMEFLYEQKDFKGFYGKFSYTLSWSEFKNPQGVYRPSLYDTRHTAYLSGGKHLEKGWSLGFKLSYQSRKPYTPYDFEKSSLIQSWASAQALNVPDYSRLNAERMAAILELDFRVDKEIHFDKWDLTIFVDVLNILNASPAQNPLVAIKRDSRGVPLIDPNNPAAYQTFWLENRVQTLFPSLGVIGKF